MPDDILPLEALRLRRLRGFPQIDLELKPITVLIGPNSAGKSTFGRALISLSHSHRKFEEGGVAQLSPVQRDDPSWPVDLGTYPQLLSRGCSGPIEIGLRTKEGWVEYGFGDVADPQLKVTSITLPATPATTTVQATDVAPVLETAAVEGSATAPITTRETGESPPQYEIRREEAVHWRDAKGTLIIPQLSGLQLRGLAHASGTSVSYNTIAMKQAIEILKFAQYLRPAREMPRYNYPDPGAVPETVGYSGENTAAMLHYFEGAVSFAEPPPIDPRAPALDAPWSIRTMPLIDAVRWWLTHLELAHYARSRVDQKFLHVEVGAHTDHPDRALPEVGFALSQILPILVAGLTLRSGAHLVIELPEAHLHPHPQLLMADFFCSLAKTGRRFLLETHSEMLFHGLRIRAAFDRELAEQIGIYFVDSPGQDGLCRHPRPIALDEEGELKWPAGFLTEGLDVEASVRSARRTRRAQGGAR